jgi:hypothetical protein
MRANPRRRRRSGSLRALKSSIWACIEYNLGVIDDAEQDHEVRQRACNSLTQAALAYAKILELHDFERQVRDLEALTPRNGDHAA